MISTVDEEGVALAAIKALQTQAAAKDRRIASLERRLAAIETRLDGPKISVMRSKSDFGR